MSDDDDNSFLGLSAIYDKQFNSTERTQKRYDS